MRKSEGILEEKYRQEEGDKLAESGNHGYSEGAPFAQQVEDTLDTQGLESHVSSDATPEEWNVES